MTPEDASSRPDLVSELRLRIPLPLVVPVVAVAVIFACTYGFSRILLAVSPEAATTIALVVAANILVACAFVALRPRMHRVGVLEVVLIALYPVLIGVVLAYTGVASETGEAAEQPAAEPEQPGQTTASGSNITVTTENLAFDASELQFPAGKQVSLALDNQDTVPHNLSLYATEEDGQAQTNALFKGANVDAGASTTYEFKAPKRGDYYFQCDIHPTMNGDVVVK
jgi:plastocyanin